MKATIWSKENCLYCDQAKLLLEQHNIEYVENIIGQGYTKEDLLNTVPNARSVPQIFLDDELVGGFNELRIKLKAVA